MRGAGLALVLLVGLPLALAGTTGCEKKKSESPRKIVRAYQSYQQASPSDRAAALADMAAAPCDDPGMCADRDACVGYAKALERARELTAKARELGPEDGGGNGAATESERATILAGAQDALEQAEKAHPTCEAALARLSGP